MQTLFPERSAPNITHAWQWNSTNLNANTNTNLISHPTISEIPINPASFEKRCGRGGEHFGPVWI